MLIKTLFDVEKEESNSSGDSSGEEIVKKDHIYKEDSDRQKNADQGTNHELQQIKQTLSDTRESQLKCFEEQQKRFEDLQQQLKAAMDEQAAQQEELKKQYEELKMSRGKADGLTDDVQDKQLEEARELLQEQQENMTNDFKKHQKLLEELLHQRSHAEGKPKEEKKKKNSSDGSASDSDNHSISDSSAGSTKKSFQHLSANQDNVPSNLQFHVTSGGKEACLWTKGSHGLLICK